MYEREIVPRTSTVVAGDNVTPPKDDDMSAIWLGAILSLGLGGAIWYSRREKYAGFT